MASLALNQINLVTVFCRPIIRSIKTSLITSAQTILVRTDKKTFLLSFLISNNYALFIFPKNTQKTKTCQPVHDNRLEIE